MCCFSRPVKLVADTNIFARAGKEGYQSLVYSMIMNAAEPLAMILPIPVPKATKEDAVKFINLEKYPTFFAEMRTGFPPPPPPRQGGTKGPPDNSLGLPTLKVEKVGSFIASFVPTVKDFSRLDEQFRLPSTVWDKLPAYADHGFVVFKLEKGAQKVHPMAFSFPRANPKQLFFPTVHIHDGKVHETAKFDHALFCQSSGENLMAWEESKQPAEMFMKNVSKSQGLIDPKAHCYRKLIVGRRKNADILV